MSDTSTKHEHEPTALGRNRTGIAMSPADAEKTIQGAAEGSPPPVDEPIGYAAEKLAYSGAAGPYGSVPPPLSLKGMAKTAVDLVTGKKTTVLVDKLAERLAFERGGTRLYEALLVKLDAAEPHEGGPTRDELEEIRDDEQRHFGILIKALRSLGADPTAMTPCADLVGVMSAGLVQALNDPRTTLTQGLEAVLVAELTDNESWDLLIELTADLGEDDLAVEFGQARDQEREHLLKVRSWLANAVRGQAGVAEAETPPQPEPQAPEPLH